MWKKTTRVPKPKAQEPKKVLSAPLSLLGHGPVINVDRDGETKITIELENGITLTGQLIAEDKMLIPQPRGGDRLYQCSDQSFDFAFKQWLEEESS